MSAVKKKSTYRRPGREKLLRLYTTMVLIRRVEETLMEVFSAGEIPGFLHVCIGQEAAPAAVCGRLERTDYIGSTHRGHGHVLAKGMELEPFLAELLGRREGFCRGRSGSMHLADKSLGILGANGIVGGGIPVVTGAALAAQYNNDGRVAVAFFGEGATGQGVFHESLNMASLWRLPVVFVCENNGWAEFTPQEVHTRTGEIASRAAAYGMPGLRVENQVLEIDRAAAQAVDRARRGEGPTLLEVKCDRWEGHYVGDAQKYRPREDLEEARSRDCLADFQKHLLQAKVLTKARVEEISRRTGTRVDQALEAARQAPQADPSELMDGVYA